MPLPLLRPDSEPEVLLEELSPLSLLLSLLSLLELSLASISRGSSRTFRFNPLRAPTGCTSMYRTGGLVP